jgi:hypothetical protein
MEAPRYLISWTHLAHMAIRVYRVDLPDVEQATTR